MIPLADSSQPTVGVLFSGGIDSGVLVAYLLNRGYRVQPLYVAGGLVWEAAELASGRRLLARLASPRLEGIEVLQLPLGDLYGDHWSLHGRNVPDASTPDEAVYLPGRNPLLIIKARLWCQLHGVDRLMLGSLLGNPFVDASREFFAAFEAVLDHAMMGHVALEQPFRELTKAEVLHLEEAFPLDLTFSCLTPQRGLHCGQCNKCHERSAALAAAGRPDPTRYAADLKSAGAVALDVVLNRSP